MNAATREEYAEPKSFCAIRSSWSGGQQLLIGLYSIDEISSGRIFRPVGICEEVALNSTARIFRPGEISSKEFKPFFHHYSKSVAGGMVGGQSGVASVAAAGAAQMSGMRMPRTRADGTPMRGNEVSTV